MQLGNENTTKYLRVKYARKNITTKKTKNLREYLNEY